MRQGLHDGVTGAELRLLFDPQEVVAGDGRTDGFPTMTMNDDDARWIQGARRSQHVTEQGCPPDGVQDLG